MKLLPLLPLVLSTACAAGPPGPTGGEFPEHWIDGLDEDEPPFQLHQYAPGTWILRQSMRTDFEGPFLYLFIGAERALLLDSGAGKVPVRAAIDHLLQEHDVPLLVAHTHGHGDHTAGDAELAARPRTHVLGTAPEEVWGFFKLEDATRDVATLDLGGRKLDVFAIPGHEAAHIAVYDRTTGALVTGDSLYPGRLYVGHANWETYARSMRRLARWCRTHEVTDVLGTHIEMTAEPGVDYEFASTEHANERALQLGPEHVYELVETIAAMSRGEELERTARDDFIVFPLRPRRRDSD